MAQGQAAQPANGPFVPTFAPSFAEASAGRKASAFADRPAFAAEVTASAEWAKSALDDCRSAGKEAALAAAAGYAVPIFWVTPAGAGRGHRAKGRSGWW